MFLRLREKCEKLLVIPNSVYRRKTEDLLWKKVFYDVIAKCRGAKKVGFTDDVYVVINYYLFVCLLFT